jgi:drug/metabolite transporter (DMT)-like permease
MLFSIYVFKEKLTKRKLIAIFLSFVGCGLITGLLTPGGMKLTTSALIAGLAAGIGYGSQGVFIKKLMEKYSQLTVVFYIFFFAALASVFFCQPLKIAQVFIEAPASAFYGIGGTLIVYVLPFAMYTYSLHFIEASKAAVVVSIEPFFTAFIGLFLYNEPINLAVIAGTILIVSAIVVLYEKAKNE